MDTTEQAPQDLRAALADHIRSRGTFRTAAVEAAFRTVPRNVFLPGVDLRTAYASKPVSYCQYLWIKIFYAAVGEVWSAGRSTCLPSMNVAPARTSATSCGAFTARQRA